MLSVKLGEEGLDNEGMSKNILLGVMSRAGGYPEKRVAVCASRRLGMTPMSMFLRSTGSAAEWQLSNTISGLAVVSVGTAGRAVLAVHRSLRARSVWWRQRVGGARRLDSWLAEGWDAVLFSRASQPRRHYMPVSSDRRPRDGELQTHVRLHEPSRGVERVVFCCGQLAETLPGEPR